MRDETGRCCPETRPTPPSQGIAPDDGNEGAGAEAARRRARCVQAGWRNGCACRSETVASLHSTVSRRDGYRKQQHDLRRCAVVGGHRVTRVSNGTPSPSARGYVVVLRNGRALEPGGLRCGGWPPARLDEVPSPAAVRGRRRLGRAHLNQHARRRCGALVPRAHSNRPRHCQAMPRAGPYLPWNLRVWILTLSGVPLYQHLPHSSQAPATTARSMTERHGP